MADMRARPARRGKRAEPPAAGEARWWKLPRGARPVLKHVAAGLFVLWVVSVIVFAATQVMPGDVAKIILGPTGTEERVTQLRANLGLDRSLVAQYWDWLTGVLTGNMGQSLVGGRPVADILAGRILNSAFLTAVAMALVLPVSLVSGLLAALFRDKLIDRTYLWVALAVTSIPEFVIGSIIIMLFGTTVLPILPPVSLIPPGEMPWADPAALVMPVTVMGIVGVTYLSRLVRVSFIDVMESEYFRFGEIRGLSLPRLMLRHALPNALAASIPAASIMVAYTIAGSVVIEYLFAYPGIGAALVDAVSQHNLPVIQAIILIIASAFYILNRLADIFSHKTKLR